MGDPGIVRILRLPAAIHVQRLRVAPAADQRLAKEVVCIVALRRQQEGLAVSRHRRLGVAGIPQCIAEVDPALGEVGRQRQAAPIRGGGLGAAALRLQHHAEIVVCRREFRPGSDHRLICLFCLRRQPQFHLHVAEVVARVDVAGRERQRALDQRQRILAPAALMQQHAKVVQGVRMVRRRSEEGPVATFGVVQPTGLVGRHRMAQHGVALRRIGTG